MKKAKKVLFPCFFLIFLYPFEWRLSFLSHWLNRLNAIIVVSFFSRLGMPVKLSLENYSVTVSDFTLILVERFSVLYALIILLMFLSILPWISRQAWKRVLAIGTKAWRCGGSCFDFESSTILSTALFKSTCCFPICNVSFEMIIRASAASRRHVSTIVFRNSLSRISGCRAIRSTPFAADPTALSVVLSRSALSAPYNHLSWSSPIVQVLKKTSNCFHSYSFPFPFF